MSGRLFITSTGTSAGKTWVTRGLAAALRARGDRVAAVKPLETGCTPEPLDALALARACGVLHLASEPAFLRAAAAVSPYAAVLLGESGPDLTRIVARVRALAGDYEFLLVEGAGGLLVPLDRYRDQADLARELAFPLLLVAPNRLGTLSHTLAALEAAHTRGLEVRAIVLTEPDARPDASSSTNRQILQERVGVPILEFPSCPDDDAALAQAAASSILPAVFS